VVLTLTLVQILPQDMAESGLSSSQPSMLFCAQAEVGDAQLVSNSLGPFLTLASKTSLADPIGSAGFGAAEEAAAAAAAADAAAEADAEEAAERAARRDTAGPGGQAPSSPQPPETPEGRHSHGGGPAAAGMCFAQYALCELKND
jgi:hypothetical protein